MTRTNDNLIIRVGSLSLNKILSKIVCGCEGLSLHPLVMRTVTSFISLTAPKIPEPSAPEIQPFLSQIARDSRLPPTPHVPRQDTGQLLTPFNHPAAIIIGDPKLLFWS